MIEQKKIQAQLCLSAKAKLTLSEIPDFAEKTVDRLYGEAVQLGLEIAAPLKFIYLGIDGNPKTKFDLIVALPVKKKKGESQAFQYIETKPLTFACQDYRGSMDGIGQAWGSFINAVHKEHLKTEGECREVYKQWVAFESKDNVTELQVALAG